MPLPSSFSTIDSPAQWNRLISALPRPHILQTWEWGNFKERHGWQAQRLVWDDGLAAAQVLTRQTGGLRIMYVPKGPLLDWHDDARRRRVLNDLEALARCRRALFIKIDPDVPVAEGLPGAEHPNSLGATVTAELKLRHWRFSPEQIQFRNTVIMDLCRSEAELLAAMKQKTRYNLRLAEKKGVRVRRGSPEDIDLLYRLYAETARRDGFIIRAPQYYADAWGSFFDAGLAQPFVAEIDGEPAAALILFVFGGTAWYMYGMSRAAHREKMPNHLLQWEAIRWAKTNGCLRYDFWGAPDEFVETDRMWGVWKFKSGFGGQVVRHIGAWDYPPRWPAYRLYTVVRPWILSAGRRLSANLLRFSSSGSML